MLLCLARVKSRSVTFDPPFPRHSLLALPPHRSARAAMSGYATMRASAPKDGEKKTEEEDFTTGPLSVLKQSVSSNTQVSSQLHHCIARA